MSTLDWRKRPITKRFVVSWNARELLAYVPANWHEMVKYWVAAGVQENDLLRMVAEVRQEQVEEDSPYHPWYSLCGRAAEYIGGEEWVIL